jgi:DNA-binding transcriptional LysR family regulator
VHSPPSLRDIGCFALVARRLSFSGAAAELGLTQSAVSQAVARLERALELRLLDRGGGAVVLTEAGRTLLTRAETLLGQADAFLAEAARLARPDPGGISLAYAPLVGALAAKIARRLLLRKPGVDVALVPAGWQSATTALEQATVSAALMATPFPPGFASTARFLVPITHVAVRAGDRLASGTRVRAEQLFGHEVLVPRTLWAGVRTLYPEQPRLTVIDDDLTAGCDLVAAGRGVLPVPRLLADTLRRPDLAYVPFDTTLHLTFALVWAPERVTPEVVALIQTAQEALRTK